MSTHEFKLHHCVCELMQLLNIHQLESNVGAEIYSNVLQKSAQQTVSQAISMSPAVIIGAKQSIVSNSLNSEEFLQKYSQIKSKNVQLLDPLVYLISKIVTNQQLKNFVSSTKQQAQIQPSCLANLTQTNLDIDNMKKNISKPKFQKKSGRKSSNLLNNMDIKLERTFLTFDFIPIDENNYQYQKIGEYHPTLQESAIIEDILFCCEGLSGKYIIPLILENSTSKREFRIDITLDSSLKELVLRILPLCSAYSIIMRFIETKSAYHYGKANHALAAAIKSLMENYMILIAQLEYQNKTNQLTLQKLWYYLQPTMKTLGILSKLVNSINQSKFIGGKLLTILHEIIINSIGDEDENQLCKYLIKKSIVPFLDILEKWIYKGIIHDTYSEFMIVENDNIVRETDKNVNDDTSYWEKRYSVRRETTPIFLDQLADKILSTGKYLNVVRQTGQIIDFPDQLDKMEYEDNLYKMQDILEKAHEEASHTLLRMLIDNYHLLDRFKSLKHCFLLDQGDCIVQFMDLAEEEMMRPVPSNAVERKRLLVRLESLVELSIRTSVANEDQFKDDIKVDLLGDSLVDQMLKILTIETKHEKDFKSTSDRSLTCLESFSFDYIVSWPVSIILSKKVLSNYQMLFRRLFYAKHVERQLCGVWLKDKASKLLSLKSARNVHLSAFVLRQKMLSFIQNLLHYMTFEVIEVRYKHFENSVSNVSNVDDLLRMHVDFLNDCLADCLLTSTRLLGHVHKVMIVCLKFAKYMQSVGLSEMESTTLMQYVSKCDVAFTEYLGLLLTAVIESSVTTSKHSYLNILYRLDFNNYYKNNVKTIYEIQK